MKRINLFEIHSNLKVENAVPAERFNFNLSTDNTPIKTCLSVCTGPHRAFTVRNPMNLNEVDSFFHMNIDQSNQFKGTFLCKKYIQVNLAKFSLESEKSVTDANIQWHRR